MSVLFHIPFTNRHFQSVNEPFCFLSFSGIVGVDQVLNVLLTTAMFVGGSVAFILDNTIPGEAFNLFCFTLDVVKNKYSLKQSIHCAIKFRVWMILMILYQYNVIVVKKWLLVFVEDTKQCKGRKFVAIIINLSSLSPQVLPKNEASESWNVALVSVQQSWKEWDLMICHLEWTSSADTPSSSISPSAPPSQAISGGGYGKPAGAGWDMGMQWREEELEGREVHHRGRVEYSQRAGAEKCKIWLNLGSKGWYTKIKGWESGGQKTVQDLGSCGRKCNAPTPCQFVFSLACVSLFLLPTLIFSACYSKSQHAVKDVTMRRFVGVDACVYSMQQEITGLCMNLLAL